MLLYDNFASNSTFTWSTDGQTSPDGQITNAFLAGGQAGVHAQNGGGPNVFFQFPQTTTSTGNSFGNRNDFNHTIPPYTNYHVNLYFRTIQQLRTGVAGSPNPWEVAWLIFNRVDATHAYGLILKTAGFGTEIDKNDGGGEIIVYTNSSGPSNNIGTWYTWDLYVRNGNQFTVYVNGILIGTTIDNSQAINYFANPTGLSMYCEDASVEYGNISVWKLGGAYDKDSTLDLDMPGSIT